MKKVLVVGQGGREHAIVMALAQSPNITQVYVSPGSQGMAPGQSVKLDLTQPEAVAIWCKEQGISLVVIGPEQYLVDGMADALRDHGLSVFGPSARGAALEGSKIYAKEFMAKHNVPTSFYKVVSSVDDVLKVVDLFTPPYVLKADGLAGGKGVAICLDKEELMTVAHSYFFDKKFGTAGEKAILEQFQKGYELSFFILTNGRDYVSLPLAQDHKRLEANNKGPNTGGMGAVAPMKIEGHLYKQIISQVVEPTVAGLQKEDYDYRGVVFIGLMITDQGPQVIEYNVRFGDPETQVLLPLLDGHWGDVFSHVAEGHIPPLNWSSNHSCCVVLAAEGYPLSPKKGTIIRGDLSPGSKSYCLHAGTQQRNQQWVTSGGRVLNVVGLGSSFNEARQNCYDRVKTITFDGMQLREDIGANVPAQ